MTAQEIRAIENVINALRCTPRANGQHRAAPEVTEALSGPARIYLETWVIPSLSMLLPGADRNPKLAASLAE